MTKEQFLKEMNEELEYPSGTLEGCDNVKTLPVWDSMQRLIFIAKAEEKTGIIVEGSSVENAETVDDLVNLVSDGLGD